MLTKLSYIAKDICITINTLALPKRHQPSAEAGKATMKLEYWPPLILLIIGGAFYFSGMLFDEQPPTATPTTTQQEVPGKDASDTDQEQSLNTRSSQQKNPEKDEKNTNHEQPLSTHPKLPAKGKTETERYRLF